jgi:hypothetical protein
VIVEADLALANAYWDQAARRAQAGAVCLRFYDRMRMTGGVANPPTVALLDESLASAKRRF